MDEDPYSKLSLKEIIEEEKFQRMLDEISNEEVIQLKAGEKLPDELKNKKVEKKVEKKQPKAEPKTIEKKESSNEDEILKKIETSNPSIEIKKPEKKVEKPEISESVISNSNKNSGKVVSANDLEKLIGKKESNQKAKEAPKVPVKKTKPVDPPANTVELSRFYSGFRVEVLTSPSKLPGSHEVFLQFGNLVLEETKDGRFAYLLGDFKEKKDANSFHENIVAPRYPKAKIIQYSDGKRVLE